MSQSLGRGSGSLLLTTGGMYIDWAVPLCCPVSPPASKPGHSSKSLSAWYPGPTEFFLSLA